jgi:hypothetical protein
MFKLIEIGLITFFGKRRSTVMFERLERALAYRQDKKKKASVSIHQQQATL